MMGKGKVISEMKGASGSINHVELTKAICSLDYVSEELRALLAELHGESVSDSNKTAPTECLSLVELLRNGTSMIESRKETMLSLIEDIRCSLLR